MSVSVKVGQTWLIPWGEAEVLRMRAIDMPITSDRVVFEEIVERGTKPRRLAITVETLLRSAALDDRLPLVDPDVEIDDEPTVIIRPGDR